VVPLHSMLFCTNVLLRNAAAHQGARMTRPFIIHEWSDIPTSQCVFGDARQRWICDRLYLSTKYGGKFRRFPCVYLGRVGSGESDGGACGAW